VSLTQFQALIVGSIAGALMKAGATEGHLLIDIEVETDPEGNYTNKILVTGRESGEELLVTVTRFSEEYDTPETVEEKMLAAKDIRDRFDEILGGA
jgi:hypothetical protein